jgi:hypothetical protein
MRNVIFPIRCGVVILTGENPSFYIYAGRKGLLWLIHLCKDQLNYNQSTKASAAWHLFRRQWGLSKPQKEVFRYEERQVSLAIVRPLCSSLFAPPPPPPPTLGTCTRAVLFIETPVIGGGGSLSLSYCLHLFCILRRRGGGEIPTKTTCQLYSFRYFFYGLTKVRRLLGHDEKTGGGGGVQVLHCL